MLRNLIARLALAAALAGAVLATTVMPAAAAMPDGAYARFNFGGGEGGLVFLSYTGATTVNAGVLGLLSSQEYFLRGSSQGCGHEPTSANKVFRIKGMTDANGILWRHDNGTIAAKVNSIWLGPTDGSAPPKCAISFNFDRMEVAAGDWNGDAVLGIWDKEHVLSLLVRQPNDQARLSIVVDGRSGDDTFTVRGVNRRCGTHPTQRFFDIPAELGVTGTFQTEMLAMTSNEMGMIRSERAIFEASRECANIIAVLIGL